MSLIFKISRLVYKKRAFSKLSIVRIHTFIGEHTIRAGYARSVALMLDIALSEIRRRVVGPAWMAVYIVRISADRNRP